MSLLMDALKKAERAKEEQSGQPDETLEMQTQQEPLELDLSPELGEHHPTPNAPGKNIPSDMSAPEAAAIADLTLMSSPAQCAPIPPAEPPSPPLDFSPRGPAPIQESPRPETSTHAEIGPQTSATANPSASNPVSSTPATGSNRENPALDDRKIAIARQKAKSVFAAKQPARSHAFLFSIVFAVLVVAGAAFGFYYWLIPSQTTSILPAQPPPQVSQAEPATSANNSSQPKTEEPLPHAADASAPPAPLKSEKTPPQNTAVTPAPPPEERPVPAPRPVNPAIQIRQSKAATQLNPVLSKAYHSFLAGDIEMAHQQYSKVLQQEANNRDALLGLAAIALSRKQSGQATAYYLKLLELNPADPEALAGLVSLQGQSDPVQSESSLKKVLAQHPQAAAVHLALGNIYAQQSRWADAQQSYFRAYSNAPNNADYAYNLAISLDHLGQGKLAMEYYQRAITLSKSGPANFDKAAVQDRDAELQQAAGN